MACIARQGSQRLQSENISVVAALLVYVQTVISTHPIVPMTKLERVDARKQSPNRSHVNEV
jgi:hypothetical protein